jgi:hypothetical protein
VDLGKIQRQAFGRALWAGSADVLAPGWPCPDDLSNKKLNRAMAEAWRAGDPHVTAVLGRRLWRRSRLDDAATARLRLTLLRLGRFREAVELTERRPAPASDARAAYERAWALAGAEQPELGLRTLAQARERGLEPGQSEPLGDLLAAETDPAGLEDWTASGAVVETALWLGLYDAAARQLASELAQSAFGLGPDAHEIVGALELARMALRGCGPAEAALLLDAVGPLYEHGAGQAAYQTVREVLAGAPDELADLEGVAAGADDSDMRALLALLLAAAGRRSSAIRRLGRLCGDLGVGSGVGFGEAAFDLARLIGQETLETTQMSFAAPLERRRVFDVFPFDGEFAALKSKLRAMAAWVDRFVLVEARTSPDGEPKPLRFEEKKTGFSAFAHKITHVVIDAFPAHVDTPWARSFYLRDQGLRGLSGVCAPQDLVLLTDADVIPDQGDVAGIEGPFGVCEAGAADREPAVVVEARFLAGGGLSCTQLGLRLFSKSGRLSARAA